MMDTPSNKSSSNVPSALEMTIIPPERVSSALVPSSLAPAPTQLGALSPPPAAPPAEPPGLADAPSVAALFQALRRRWLLAVGAGLAGALLAVGAVFLVMPPRYLVEARVLVASKSDTNPLGASYREDTEFNVFKANLPALLKSPLSLSSALNLEVAPNRLARDLTLVREQGGNAVEWLSTSLKTDYNLGPEILRITLSGDKGDEAAALLNAVVKQFLDDLDKKEKARADELVEELQKNQQKLENELNSERRQLARLEEAHNLPNAQEIKNKYELAVAALSDVSKDLRKNEADKIQAEEELKSLVERQKNLDAIPVPRDDIDSLIRNDLEFQPLFLDLAKKEKDLQEAIRVAPNAAGPYREARELAKKAIDDRVEEKRPELEAVLRQKLAEQMKVAEIAQRDRQKTLIRQGDVLRKLVQEAGAEVARYTSGVQNAPAEVLSLRDKVASSEKAVGEVQQKITVLRANTSKARASLLQRAVEPPEKDIARQTKIAGAGGIGMFGLILLGVAFLEFRSRKVIGADDVARGLGMTVVGTVPPMPEEARKPTPGGATQKEMYWQSRLMESIDGIRTMLLHTARNDSLRVIMVTSAVGGEGKTSLASQLAASLARAWKRTLLIDGDLRNPAAHRVLNVPRDPGFSEVLRGEVEAAQAIRATTISRLWTMPAGHWDAHAVQALAQDQVRAMFQALKQQYDFVIVDSCPVLPVADALLLAQHVDGVLFSVMRDVSRIPAVWSAQQRLHNLGIRTLGAVVIGDRSTDLGGAAYKYALASAGK